MENMFTECNSQEKVPCDNDFEVYRELDGAIQK